MKLFRNAIIMVVVLGLLVGAYFFISSKKTGDPAAASDTTADKTISILKVAQEKIISLSYSNKNGSFTLNKKNKAWSVEPAMELPIDNSVAEASASDMSAVSAEKLIEEKASDPGKYGLDKPTTVKIGTSDGKTYELEVGTLSPTNEGIYVRKKGEDKIYLLGSYYLDKLNLKKTYFAGKQILAVDATTLKKFSYEKAGKMQFAFSINSESDMKVIAPIQEVAEVSSIQSILKSVVQLAISEVIDENPSDLAKYGLDKPAYVIEYGDSKTTKKILFGKAEKSSILYAKFDGGKTVFTIDISPLSFLDMKLGDVVNPFIYMPNINDVNKIELSIDGKTIVSDITTVKDNSDKDTFKVDGKDANMKNKDDKSLFRNFYSSMIGITMAKYEPDAKPKGAPEVTIKYYMKPNSELVKIDLISKDDNYYYAMRNGLYLNRLVLKSKLNDPDGIRESYKELKNAIDGAK
jgi:hypothetical protein